MLGEAIDRLIQANLVLWHQEDRRRDRSLTDSERLAAADEITVWNRKRNQAIDEINRLVADRLSGAAPELPETGSTPLTGSIGDLIDRLAIAKIRRFHLEESGETDRLPSVSAEIADLICQINEASALASSLSEKDRQRLFGFGKNKVYRNDETYR
ncbi:MAG TPA: DUF4254 domain-containing protein [bacterium]|nr:DUF4254 domain-containing protein [bacterium]